MYDTPFGLDTHRVRCSAESVHASTLHDTVRTLYISLSVSLIGLPSIEALAD